MGWLTHRRPALPTHSEKNAAYSEHVEDITPSPTQLQTRTFLDREYPSQDPSTADSDLPYIDPAVLSLVEKSWNSALTADKSHNTDTSPPFPPAWIVIDNIVYDCTDFQHHHPGGSVVIRSFVGQDCSWQFWRFHGKEQMKRAGTGLRIGRTSGVRNRFTETPRYVGSSSLDDW
ncbi:hypothetical protein ASPVEDRAFT_40236 [Aspergillus versicolor CBS 583.65]|uniref:Cytochrome b5 heme-binding domain-containing protein n=1 Tax=Aspergillus versicolor CBS 583.65 TaxID=1036611 RepID=A0A1L9PGX0_ASPVE|nr:uncharacterized protein ASPVEDRAFT_40236 [Aspergillus versicolor CBS 583.65]OJJ00695.1 hypothetical protein ASPVEDRAFT_40236 [Aspergillus versicolor CBS 583.65]